MALKVLDSLADKGIIEAYTGKPRKVLKSKEELEQILEEYKQQATNNEPVQPTNSQPSQPTPQQQPTQQQPVSQPSPQQPVSQPDQETPQQTQEDKDYNKKKIIIKSTIKALTNLVRKNEFEVESDGSVRFSDEKVQNSMINKLQLIKENEDFIENDEELEKAWNDFIEEYNKIKEAKPMKGPEVNPVSQDENEENRNEQEEENENTDLDTVQAEARRFLKSREIQIKRFKKEVKGLKLPNVIAGKKVNTNDGRDINRCDQYLEMLKEQLEKVDDANDFETAQKALEKMKKIDEKMNPCNFVASSVDAVAKDGKYVLKMMNGKTKEIDINDPETLKKYGIATIPDDVDRSDLRKYIRAKDKEECKRKLVKKYKKEGLSSEEALKKAQKVVNSSGMSMDPMYLRRYRVAHKKDSEVDVTDPVLVKILAKIDEDFSKAMQVQDKKGKTEHISLNKQRYERSLPALIKRINRMQKKKMTIKYDMTDRDPKDMKQSYMAEIAVAMRRKSIRRVKGYKSNLRLKLKAQNDKVKEKIDNARAEKLSDSIEEIQTNFGKKQQYQTIQKMVEEGKITKRNAKFLVRRLGLTEQQKEQKADEKSSKKEKKERDKESKKEEKQEKKDSVRRIKENIKELKDKDEKEISEILEGRVKVGTLTQEESDKIKEQLDKIREKMEKKAAKKKEKEEEEKEETSEELKGPVVQKVDIQRVRNGLNERKFGKSKVDLEKEGYTKQEITMIEEAFLDTKRQMAISCIDKYEGNIDNMPWVKGALVDELRAVKKSLINNWDKLSPQNKAAWKNTIIQYITAENRRGLLGESEEEKNTRISKILGKLTLPKDVITELENSAKQNVGMKSQEQK